MRKKEGERKRINFSFSGGLGEKIDALIAFKEVTITQVFRVALDLIERISLEEKKGARIIIRDPLAQEEDCELTALLAKLNEKNKNKQKGKKTRVNLVFSLEFWKRIDAIKEGKKTTATRLFTKAIELMHALVEAKKQNKEIISHNPFGQDKNRVLIFVHLKNY